MGERTYGLPDCAFCTSAEITTSNKSFTVVANVEIPLMVTLFPQFTSAVVTIGKISPDFFPRASKSPYYDSKPQAYRGNKYGEG